MNFSQKKKLILNCFHIRRKPLVLQMPITSRYNSRCKTCNVWKYKDNQDIDYSLLEKALKDPFFCEVKAVGLNGGEFTLVRDFIKILQAVLTLPKLKSVSLISNGLFPNRLFEYLKEAKFLCERKNVILNICISVDGVGPVHEQVRGIPNCFIKSIKILKELTDNKELYCDNVSVGCTLSKYNIYYIREIEEFFNQFDNLRVEYHLAVPNKRIKTFDDYEDYYIMTDDYARHLATEFFYTQFISAKSESFRRQQFVNFFFLKTGGKKRLCTCDYLYQDVTIDENLDMSLCATASDVIGNLKEKSASSIIFSKHTEQVRKQNQKLCDSCIHYSYHPLTIRGRVCYINEILKNQFIHQYYNACAQTSIRGKWRLYLSLIKNAGYLYLKLMYKYIWKLQ